ncbi:MAG: hypothetical protein DCF15_17405 [Phormidesmis priestleyi]|uniref:Uncharacterized protein n=1 Tax=Phormidesmis priestleyi TaxID=268141 RepID=A0A2W4WV23_9CYAN|nr:MAG: hypothetical protein DCF15_17405 [Phormidesmis priestleyi]
MNSVSPDGPSSRSFSGVSAGEPAEKLGDIKDFPMFQQCPSVCTVCHFFNDSEVREQSYSYLNLTETKKISEVCQKLTRLPYLQSDWAEKESSVMSKSLSSATDLKPSLNRDRTDINHSDINHSDINHSDINHTDINPGIDADDNLDINPEKVPINDIADRHSRDQKQIAAQVLTEKGLREQIYALSAQVADIKYLHRKEIYQLNTLHQAERLDLLKQYEARFQAYQRRYQPAIAVPAAAPKAIPEPAMQPTTYQVPRDRTSVSQLRQTFSATPFLLSMMGLGVALAFSVLLAYPSEATLGSFVSVMMAVVPVLFLIGIFSLVITAVLELNR